MSAPRGVPSPSLSKPDDFVSLAWEFFDILIKVQKDMSALRLTTSESRPPIVRVADGTTKWYKA